jgi:hypothetical protein
MSLLSLSWRLLLSAALVGNPLAGAAGMLSAHATRATENTQMAGEQMPPCHEMATETATLAPSIAVKHHGDCGNSGCQFAGCCAIGALSLSAPPGMPLMFIGAQSLPSLEFLQANSPPPARMIRPPIG